MTTIHFLQRTLVNEAIFHFVEEEQPRQLIDMTQVDEQQQQILEDVMHRVKKLRPKMESKLFAKPSSEFPGDVGVEQSPKPQQTKDTGSSMLTGNNDAETAKLCAKLSIELTSNVGVEQTTAGKRQLFKHACNSDFSDRHTDEQQRC